MLKGIMRLWGFIFGVPEPKNNLEEFIIDNNPQSIFDVEFLECQFRKEKMYQSRA